MRDKAVQLVLSAVLGTGIGWAANALTLTGRVAAIEAGQSRIEQQLAVLLTQAGARQ